MPINAYAYCRRLDAQTGAVLMDGTTWAASPAPMLDVVLRVLRTPLGKYLPDKTFGVDYNLLQKITPTTGAAWRAEIIRATKRYVDLGLISPPVITLDVTSSSLVYEVAFHDIRADQRVSTGKIRV